MPYGTALEGDFAKQKLVTRMEITTLSIHDFLEFLAGCESLDDIRAAIHAWHKANPRPRSQAEINAHVDEVLAGWYLPPDGYDPRVVGPVLDGLARSPRELCVSLGGPMPSRHSRHAGG